MMNIKKVLLSITLGTFITGVFALIAHLKRSALSSAYELEAVDIAVFALMAAVLSAFLYLKVIGRD